MIKKYFSKYFTRLLLLCLLIGSIPIVAQTVFSYVKSLKIVQEKEELSNASLLKQSQMHIEERLRSIEMAMLQFSGTKTVRQAMQTDFVEKDFLLAQELFQNIAGLHTFQHGVQGIFLINIAKNWFVDYSSARSLEETGKTETYRRLFADGNPSYWTIDDSYLPPHLNKFGITQHLLLVQKIPLLATATDGLLIAQLYPNELNRIIASTKDHQTLLVLDEQYRVVAHSPSEQFRFNQRLDSSSFLENMARQTEHEGYFEAEFDGMKTGISYAKSSYNGWTYLSIVPHELLRTETRNLGILSLGFGLFILLLIVIISFYGAKRMYIPVRKLDEKTQQQIELLKNYFFHELLKGGLSSSDIKSKMENYGLKDDFHKYSVVVAQIENLERTHYAPKDIDLLMFALHNIAEELFDSHVRFGTVLVDKYFAVIVKHRDPSFESIKTDVYAFAEKLRENVYKYMKLEICIGISNPYEKIEDAQIAYQEAVEALKYRGQLGQTAILYLRDLQPLGERDVVHYPIRAMHLLSEYIKAGDVGKAEESMRDVIRQLPYEHVHILEYQFVLLRIFVDMLKIPADLGISIGGLEVADNFDTDQLLGKTREELVAWFNRELIGPIIQAIVSNRNAQHVRAVEEIIRIIHTEFDQDLTLEAVAARLDLQPAHIRKMLKQELDCSFSQYLSTYRLNIAKQWLATTDMKVMDIAERLRYNNTQNFIRYFRKTTGVTPGMFRDACMLTAEAVNGEPFVYKSKTN